MKKHDLSCSFKGENAPCNCPALPVCMNEWKEDIKRRVARYVKGIAAQGMIFEYVFQVIEHEVAKAAAAATKAEKERCIRVAESFSVSSVCDNGSCTCRKAFGRLKSFLEQDKI